MADQDIPVGSGDYVPHHEFEQKVLGHCMEAVQEGDNYIRNQKGFRSGEEMRKMLDEEEGIARLDGLSRTRDNELSRVFHTVAADSTDFRPTWQYESFNYKYEHQARIHSNILSWWYPKYGERAYDLMVKEAYIRGTGIGKMIWDRYEEEIVMRTPSAGDVMPIRPHESDPYSFQPCFGVVERQERTVNYVLDTYGELLGPKARYIVAERDASIAGQVARASAQLNSRSPLNIAARMVRSPERRLGNVPVLDVFHYYIDDRSRNPHHEDELMGDWGEDENGNPIALNDWSYRVKKDELRYPNKRLIVFTRQCVIYDGPSIYWHGMFPYTKLQMDPLPGRWFGSSPMWRLIPLQRSLDKLYQAIDDHVQRVMSPPVKGNALVADTEMRKINTRMPNQRWKAKPGAEIGIEQIPNLDPIVEKQRDHIINRMREHAAIQTLINAATAGQIPESASLDKLMQSMTPEIRARSRALEATQRELGTMFVYNVAQFWSMSRRISLLGSDGQTFEDYDIDPQSLVPAFTNGDFRDGRMIEGREMDLRPRMDRAKNFYRQFQLVIKPGTMLQSAEQQEKLLYMGMRRQGDIPRYTFLSKMGVPNLGPQPKGNVIEQLNQEMMEQAMMKAGIMPGMQGALAGLLGAAGGAGAGGASGAVGPKIGDSRPGPTPSAQEMPNMRNDGRIEES